MSLHRTPLAVGALFALLSVLTACTEPAQSPVSPDPVPAPTPAPAVFSMLGAQSAVVLNPANGHYYQAVSHIPEGILYEDAKAAAATRRLSHCASAHLVTINSQAENDFLVQNLSQAISSPPEYYTAKNRQSYYKYFGFWIGAELVEDAAAPDGFRWSWVTGEPFDFSNWFAEGVPNGFPRETRIHFWVNPDGVADWKVGGWNDAPPYFEFPGYIVENEGCDQTPPQVQPVVQGVAGSDGWFTSDVTVSWTVGDGESAVSRVGCETATVTSDVPGQTFTCAATSLGGTTTRSVTVRRDATRPVISYSGNAGTYLLDKRVEITCSAWDGLSGLASTTCPSVYQDAYRLTPGVNTLVASAADRAGNPVSVSTTFTVIVTASDLCTVTRRLVPNARQASAMCLLLDQAVLAAGRGNLVDKQGAINGYIRQAQSLGGREISLDDAAALVRLAGAV